MPEGRKCVTISTQRQLEDWSVSGQGRSVCLHSFIPGPSILRLRYRDDVNVYRCHPKGMEVYGVDRDCRLNFAADNSKLYFYGSGNVTVVSGEAEVYGHAEVNAIGGSIKAGPTVIVFKEGLADITGGQVVFRNSNVPRDVPGWADYYGIHRSTWEGRETLLVYKSVNNDYRSNHGAFYAPGSNPEAADWQPTLGCGSGLHFSPTPSMALEYGCFSEGNRRFLRCAILPGEAVALTDKIKAKRVVGGCVEVSINRVPVPRTEAEILLSRARKVERYRGAPSATRIGKELGVGRKQATELAQQLRTEAAG